MNKLKSKILAILIPMLFICSAVFVMPVTAENPWEDEFPSWNDFYPNVNMPNDDDIQMYVTYDNTENNSYFNMELRYINDTDSHIQNGNYDAWCFQKNINMLREVWLDIKFYHTYDPDKPDEYKDSNWDEINFIINVYEHLDYSAEDIQDAIWWYMNPNMAISENTQRLIQYANTYGRGFIPSLGQKIAVITNYTGNDPDEDCQRTVIEVILDDYEGLPYCCWSPCSCYNGGGFASTSVKQPPVDFPSEETEIAEIFDVHGAIGGQTLAEFSETVDRIEPVTRAFNTLQNNDHLTFNDTIQITLIASKQVVTVWLLQEAIAAFYNIADDDITYPLNLGQLGTAITDLNLFQEDSDGYDIARFYLILRTYNNLGMN